MPAPSRAQVRVAALQRLTKEHQMYAKELEQYRAKLTEVQNSGADAYEVKKVRELVQETASMLPRVQEKIETELKAVKELGSDPEVGEKSAAVVASTEEYLKGL